VELARASTPQGVPAISRGLSAAIPPVGVKANRTPEGCQQTRAWISALSNDDFLPIAATPAGSNIAETDSGGIAALNPRLMAGTPMGSRAREQKRNARDLGRQGHFAQPVRASPVWAIRIAPRLSLSNRDRCHRGGYTGSHRSDAAVKIFVRAAAGDLS